MINVTTYIMVYDIDCLFSDMSISSFIVILSIKNEN